MTKMTYTLEQIENACSKASPEPWEAKTNRHRQCNGEPWGWISGAQDNTTWSGIRGRINADFIAIARTALPELVARVRELESKSELLKEDE